MAYSLDEMRKLRKGSGNFRKLELKVEAPKKIWIPKLLVTYRRRHSNIKVITSFKTARGEWKDCFNQNYGEKGKGCPICDTETRALWDLWKKAKAEDDEGLMKKILSNINELTGEEFYINVIDTKDDERRYFGARFTPAVFKQLEAIDAKHGIDNVIITFSKTEKPTRYAVTAEDDRPELIKELKASLDMFDGRDEADGGQIDLDKALIQVCTIDEYNSWLTSGEAGEASTEDSLEGKTEGKSKASFTKPADKKVDKKADKKAEEKPKATESLDDVIPLDDLDAPPTPPVTKAKETVKADPIKSDLDNVPDLDNLDLDNLEDAEKMVPLEAKTVNEKRSDKVYIGRIYDFLLKEKKIEAKAEYKDQLMAVYTYIKGKDGKIEVPSSVV